MAWKSQALRELNFSSESAATTGNIDRDKFHIFLIINNEQIYR
jgi:hypothetical protein